MISKIEYDGIPIKLWTDINEVESEALNQLKNISSLPWVFHHVAVMPDVHYGKGATVGSVIAMKQAVSPAAVGVDIGCGMTAIKTNLNAKDLPDNLKTIRSEIEKNIPVGFNQHEKMVQSKGVADLFSEFKELNAPVQLLLEKALKQVGTLGNGNHFIELCLDANNIIWLMLHSGSRHIGKTLAEFHINRAKNLIYNKDLPDPDLAVFLAKTYEMFEYKKDLFWAQRYAFLNREVMLELYIKTLKQFFPQLTTSFMITCHHNYVSEETHFGEDVIVTRKGAISAKKGEFGIIPGSMGTKSYIVKGLENPESFNSASHGAGRRMSRSKAKKHFSLLDLENQTLGVECRKDLDVLDEIPGAYKDIDQVMKNQNDLVEIVVELKQILCVKG